MQKDLMILRKLQEVDLKIRELELSKVEFPQQVENLEGAITSAQAELDSITTRLEELTVEKKKISTETEEATASLAKSQERLNTITTNREYDAVHTEIESAKSIIANADSRLKKVAHEEEQLTEAKKTAEEKLAQIAEENEPLIKELKDKIATIDSRIAEVMVERNTLVPQVRKQFLSTYDFIRNKRKSGLALSIVDESGTCSVCYKVLEPQIINEIKIGKNLVNCQSCGSIFAWKDHTVADEEQGEESNEQEA
ncbi:MAG: hypothetical protein GF398_00770 [Chitinivibrionales bacterium]|nr:hypothetical protein [Chitinivibrionales bacterium]